MTLINSEHHLVNLMNMKLFDLIITYNYASILETDNALIIHYI